MTCRCIARYPAAVCGIRIRRCLYRWIARAMVNVPIVGPSISLKAEALQAVIFKFSAHLDFAQDIKRLGLQCSQIIGNEVVGGL